MHDFSKLQYIFHLKVHHVKCWCESKWRDQIIFSESEELLRLGILEGALVFIWSASSLRCIFIKLSCAGPGIFQEN